MYLVQCNFCLILLQYQCSKNQCIPIEAKSCDEDFRNCVNISENATKAACHFSLREKTNECTFLTYKVKYNIYHNGTKGVKKVELLLVLKNVSYTFENEAYQFMQHYEVAFYWYNCTLNNTAFLSGNPGYQMHKLILIGNLATVVNISHIPGTNLTKTETKHEIRRNGSNITENFLVLPENVNGYCNLSNDHYTRVEFGYNLILKCKMLKNFTLNSSNASSISSVCKNIQEAIFEYWSIQISRNLSKMVGSFGNANSNKLNDWMKVLFNREPLDVLNKTSGYMGSNNESIVCQNVANSLSVDVFYARVDTKVYQNQNKIVGTTFNFHADSTNEFVLDGKNIFNQVDLHMSVIFFDITKPKIRKFVDPPTFNIRLPYDFFYPFIKLESSCTKVSLMRPVVMFCSAIISYFLI